MHADLISRMIAYDAGDPKRIQHFLKVYSFAKTIGELERIPDAEQRILEAAAIVHDIGIKASEAKYGDATGTHQEQEGPAAALPMLQKSGYTAAECERVCWLIAHHHTYTDITGSDYRILVEADFLVNLFEASSSLQAVESAYCKIFRTETGKRFCREMFGISAAKP